MMKPRLPEHFLFQLLPTLAPFASLMAVWSLKSEAVFAQNDALRSVVFQRLFHRQFHESNQGLDNSTSNSPAKNL